MISYRISLDLGSQMEMSAGISAALGPLVSKAVDGIAQQVQANWMTAARRAKAPQELRDAYAASITYEYRPGSYSAEVFSEYKYAADIENGTPPRDMKRMLDTSMKVRRTMSGARFLIIPMRHNVSDMPTHVQQAAKNLTASTITGMGLRRAGEITSARFGMGLLPLGEKRQRRNPFASDTGTRKAAMVTKFQYSWGGKLAAGSMGPNAKGKSDRFAGMVKMDQSTPNAPRSGYLTFRVMSEKSRGWIYPAQPGQNIAQKVSQDMQPRAEAVIAEAIRRSFR